MIIQVISFLIKLIVNFNSNLVIRNILKKLVRKLLSLLFKIPFSFDSFKKIYADLLSENDNKRLFSSYRLHELMISDQERLKKYRLAINKYIKKNQIVADVGAGTGFLAFLMNKNSPKKIYAIDHSNIIESAKYLIDKNNIKNITLISKNSKDFFPKEKVDVIFHELIGSGLINEGMIDPLIDLRERVLLPKKGKIYPSKFELYLEPISLKNESKKPYLWQNKVGKVDYSPLKYFLPQETKKDLFIISHFDIEKLLSIPKPIYIFDLMKIKKGEFPSKINFRKKLNQESLFDGFCLFFKVRFDDEIFFDTFPHTPKTHWENSIPYFRFPSRIITKKEMLNLSLIIRNHNKLRSWEIINTQ